MSTEKQCACSGARSCGKCRPDLHFSASAAAAASPASSDTASCTTIHLVWCPSCRGTFHSSPSGLLSNCRDHNALAPFSASSISAQEAVYPFVGLFAVPDFLSVEDEQRCLATFEGGWVPSQSGRAKIDFTCSKFNFKQKKAALKVDFAGLPLSLKPVIDAVVAAVPSVVPSSFSAECKLSEFSNCTHGIQLPADAPQETKQLLGKCGCEGQDDDSAKQQPSAPSASFSILGVAALDYQPGAAAHLDAHLDDSFFYGPRIAGVSLLSHSVMTFVQRVKGKGDDTMLQLVVRVPLPRRGLFVMSGAARYHWLHAIDARDIVQRRVSMTFREVNSGFAAKNQELASVFEKAMKTFV